MVIRELRQEIETLKEGDKKPPTFVKANKHGEKGTQPHKTRKKRAAEQNAARKSNDADGDTKARTGALSRLSLQIERAECSAKTGSD